MLATSFPGQLGLLGESHGPRGTFPGAERSCLSSAPRVSKSRAASGAGLRELRPENRQRVYEEIGELLCCSQWSIGRQPPGAQRRWERKCPAARSPGPHGAFSASLVSPPLWEASGAVADSGVSVSERGIPFFPSIRVALWVDGVYMHAPQCFCLDRYTLCEVACISM